MTPGDSPEAEAEDECFEGTAGADVPKLDEGDRVFATAYRHRPVEEVRATSTVSQRIAEGHARNNAEKEKTLHELLPSVFWDFEDVFAKKSFDTLPDHREWDHAIELTGDGKSPHRKLYPLSPVEQAELDKFLEENISSGRIRPSKSPMAAPFFFVKKKDGSLRPVQDYRLLNSITVKNKYPLPLVDDLVQRLKGARYFTKLDVRWGYNNIRIKEGDEWKAAFRTNRGLFEPLVMFFGLTNSPATFQTMMKRHLRGPDRGGSCLCLHGRHPCVCGNPGGAQSGHPDCPGTTPETQAIPQGGEVRVRAGTDRVPRTDHIAQQGRDGSGQGSSGSGMATTPGEKGGSILPRVRELLPAVH